MLETICLGLFLPLIGFLGLTMASRVVNRRWAGWIACMTVGISFVCFLSLLYVYASAGMDAIDFTLFNWIPIEKIKADVTLRLDSLSLLMSLIITGVGFLIHVYSIGYMDHEKDFARYFACLNLFVFAMLLLVLADHLLVLFVGWEGVGLASYLLIGFWHERPEAAKAATKAFVVNRIGDFGLLIGLLLTFHLFGTGRIADISQRVGQEFAVGASVLTLLTFLYFVGATGKSAQLPLYSWLPDAMEGPTPVSALIHAATMVTAGVYLVVRMHVVFSLAPATLQLIGIVGGATSLFAALCALAQTDLKRVLAYSTISQLGLMFLACGAGAFYSAMFHLTTHAFVKALLFLSAGNIVHMLHGTTDMEKMGGLSKKMPITRALFLIGVLALSGIPPFSAFFSKDLILEQEYLSGLKTLFYVGLAASILTAFYLTRAYCLTFVGHSRLGEERFSLIKEAPFIMLVPVMILGLFAVIAGVLGVSFNQSPLLESFLSQLGITAAEKEFSDHFLYMPETWLALAGGVAGIVSAAVVYTRFYDRLGQPIALLKQAFFIDDLYEIAVVKPLKSLSIFINQLVEPKIFDGSIHLATQATQGAAAWLQRFQSGQIRSYAAWMVIGTALVIVYLVF